MKEAFYDLRKNDEAKQPYHWNLVAPNNEVILTSEQYSSKQMAKHGISSVRENCEDDANYRSEVASDGRAYFVLIAQNYEIIGNSQMYSSEEARDKGIEAVKKYGKNAELKDNTGEGERKTKVITSPPKPWLSC